CFSALVFAGCVSSSVWSGVVFCAVPEVVSKRAKISAHFSSTEDLSVLYFSQISATSHSLPGNFSESWVDVSSGTVKASSVSSCVLCVHVARLETPGTTILAVWFRQQRPGTYLR